MKVLILGAAGFLGRWFTVHHIAQGDIVIGVDSFVGNGAHWPNELDLDHQLSVDAEWFCGSRYGEQRFDLAYQFAAPVGGRVKIEGDPLFNADSLRIDAAFFRWATSDGHVKTAVYPSSSAVYAPQFQNQYSPSALQEGMFNAADPNWYAPDEMYGFTKLAGEVLAWKSAGYGLSTLCIRPFSGYGEDQSLDYPIPAIARRVAERQDPLVIWGSGRQQRDFIHVSDIVKATAARLADGVTGYETLNIGTGYAVSFLSVAETLCRIEGYSPEIVTDESKPEGVSVRFADTSRMTRSYKFEIRLIDGLRRVLMYQKAMLARV